MQVFSEWTEPSGTLGAITREAFARSEALEVRLAELESACSDRRPGPSLERALRRETVGVLAEVKRRSPSKGSIAEHLAAAVQAAAYERGGARGLSILTEPDHFGGSVDDITNVLAAVGLPVLKKDFHVAPVQLLEARALGASAALLIARALAPDRLRQLVRFAGSIGLEVLVEVRDEAELERALSSGCTLVGVNNRNLETLEIDPATSDRLIPLIPAHVVAIAESGIRSVEEVRRYAAAGADAVLVGSSLSASPDPESATRDLTSVPRVARGG